jgi:protein-S-isoprenylcysteine O-methyltransferase Ste14
MDGAMLLLRSLAAAALHPGTVTIFIPWLILRRSDAMVHHWSGLVLLALGAVVLARCVRDFAVAGRGTLAPLDPPQYLVASGLYRYVRNPMYVGVVLILAGEAWVFWPGALLLDAAAFFLVANLFIVFYEEPALQRTIGESYGDHLRTVPRWVPRRTRRLPPAGS